MTYTKAMAFKEAVSDTGIAAIVNIPLNFVIVYLCHIAELGPIWTSVILTSIFTVFAITRKTYIRLYFNDEFLKKQAKEKQIV